MSKLAMALCLLFLGCASQVPPGTYRWGGWVRSETVEFEPNGSFTYRSWSDDGVCTATGSWKQTSATDLIGRGTGRIVREDFAAVCEDLVAREDVRLLSFVARAVDMKQKRCLCAIEGDVADFVNPQEKGC